jgi:hypothetical protein
MLALISGAGAFPVACHCGSHKTYADLEHRPDGSQALFVWCVDCGAEGPRAASHDAAVSAWNQSVGFCPHGRMVDNTTGYIEESATMRQPQDLAVSHDTLRANLRRMLNLLAHIGGEDVAAFKTYHQAKQALLAADRLAEGGEGS